MTWDSLNQRIRWLSKYLLGAAGMLAVLVLAGLLASGSQAALSARAARQLAPDADPGTVFGVEMTPLNDDGGLAYIEPPETQTGWARGVVVDWALVEAEQGEPDWEMLANATDELNNAFTAGLEPIVVVRGVPEWARAGDYACGPIHPDYYEAFGDFIAWVIEYEPDPDPDPNPFADVQYWSIWNEPDVDPDESNLPSDSVYGCWGDEGDTYYGGEAYGKMLNEVYPRLTDANPEALLIAGELLLDCNPDEDPTCIAGKFLEGILEASVTFDEIPFDGIAFHAYDYYAGALGHYENENWNSFWNTTGPVLIAKAQFVQDKLEQYNVSGKFLMNTEFALLWDSQLNFPMEDTKAYYIAQAYASAIAEDLKANIWYDVTGTWGRNNGLLLPDFLFRLPAYYAYQFASEKLGGATLVAPVMRYGDLVRGYEFDNANCETPGGVDCHVLVLWSLDDSGTEITLPAEPELVQDVDGIGDITESPTLTIPMEPYYIEVDAQAPGIQAVALNPNPVDFNGQVTLSATVSDALTGGSPLETAQYSLNGGLWSGLAPVDGSFDSAIEAVSASLTAPATQGSYPYNICIQSADVWGNTSAEECTLINLVVQDRVAPLAVASNPGAVAYNQPVTFSANISDTLTGGSTIQSAEYSLAGGAWTGMQALDGFNAVTEFVTASFTAPGTVGDYELCARGTDSSLNTSQADCLILAVFSPDGPSASSLLVNPNPAKTNQALTISATIDDSQTGGEPIAQAEYSLDGTRWSPMAAQDGTFDEVIESVSVSTSAPASDGVYDLCVRGTDASGNRGALLCTTLSVSRYYIGLTMLNRNWFIGELLRNGDYESGLDNWLGYTEFMPVRLVTENPLNRVDRVPDQSIPMGSGSALLGNPNAPCGSDLPFGLDVFAGMEQEIDLPEGSFTLQFKYVIYSQDISYDQATNTFYDTFEVYVNGERQFFDGNTVNQLKCKWHRVPSLENPRPEETTGWASASIDLSPYAGQKVTIAFRNYSRFDGWFNTYVFVDDVKVIASD